MVEVYRFLIVLVGILLVSLLFAKKKTPANIINKRTLSNSNIKNDVPQYNGLNIEGKAHYGSPIYFPKRKKLKYYQPTKKNPNRR